MVHAVGCRCCLAVPWRLIGVSSLATSGVSRASENQNGPWSRLQGLVFAVGMDWLAS